MTQLLDHHAAARSATETTIELPLVDPDPAQIAYLAQPGHAEAVLAVHHDDGRGRCAGCPSRPIHAHCWLVDLAWRAIRSRRWAR